MGRIGSQYAQAKIYDLNTKQNEPPFEPYQGQYSGLLIDDSDRLHMPIRNNPFSNSFTFGSVERTSFIDISRRLKSRTNKNEYETKMGRRPEGLRYAAALDKPYVNFGSVPIDISEPIQLKQMTDAQQYHLTETYPNQPMPKTYNSHITEHIAKVQAPYGITKMNVETPLNFIKEERGKYMTEMSNNNDVSDMGSTIKSKKEVASQEPSGPKNKGFLDYLAYISNPKVISQINEATRQSVLNKNKPTFFQNI